MWFKDSNGNKCSLEYFGSEEKAKAALDSLVNCRNCKNCKNCKNCDDCVYCSNCSHCSHCSSCTGCSHCSNCSHCSRCSECSDCSGCSYCSNCSGCSLCSDCSAKHETLDIPTIDNIHQKVYEACSKPNALNMSIWHTCKTTHCRAGWVVVLAGAQELEKKTSTLFAAMQIYKKSGYQINPCRFFDSNGDALEDMRRLANAN